MDSLVLNFDDEEIDASELGELLTSLSKMYSVIHYVMGSNASLELKGNVPQHYIESRTAEVVSNIQNLIIQYAKNLDHPFETSTDHMGGLIEYLHPNSSNIGRLKISRLTYNSPLRVDLKGTLMVLIVLTCIGGGEFSIGGAEGISVKMPGIGKTIKTIHESIFDGDGLFEDKLEMILDERSN